MTDIQQHNLTGKNILIIGATSDIGAAVAKVCHSHGASVYLTGRDEVKLNALINSLQSNAQSFITDLAQPIATNLFPTLDGMFYCAGIMKTLPLKLTKPELIDQILDSNLNQPIKVVQQLVANKKLNKGASLVFLSSINGTHTHSKAHSVYAASKAGIDSFCKSMALELAPNYIRVNSIAAGLIRTEGLLKSLPHLTTADFDEIAKSYPLQRIGQPIDVASAVLFLLSETSNWMTGTTLLLDGGKSISG